MITLPSSEYFTLRPIAEGIYAAIAKEGSPAFSNAGVIDTGDHIIVFDTFNTFRAAEDLRRDTEILTKRLVNFVIISHAHSDHWMGNQVFADHASILATRQTTDAMTRWADKFNKFKQNPDEYKKYIGETEKNLAKAVDPRLRQHLNWSLAIEKQEFKDLSATKLYLPNQSFDSRLDIYGADALVKILTFGAGHTDCDTLLLLPEDRIAFIGDLGFFGTHPYLGGSYPEKWIATLDDLAASKFRVFVPGHGSIGTKADLLALKAYIITLQAMAAAVVARGGSEDEAAAQPVPEFAADWAGYGRFEGSMRFLYQRLMGEGESSHPEMNISRTLRLEALQAGYTLGNKENEILAPNQLPIPSSEK